MRHFYSRLIAFFLTVFRPSIFYLGTVLLSAVRTLTFPLVPAKAIQVAFLPLRRDLSAPVLPPLPSRRFRSSLSTLQTVLLSQWLTPFHLLPRYVILYTVFVMAITPMLRFFLRLERWCMIDAFCGLCAPPAPICLILRDCFMYADHFTVLHTLAYCRFSLPRLCVK